MQRPDVAVNSCAYVVAEIASGFCLGCGSRLNSWGLTQVIYLPSWVMLTARANVLPRATFEAADCAILKRRFLPLRHAPFAARVPDIAELSVDRVRRSVWCQQPGTANQGDKRKFKRGAMAG